MASASSASWFHLIREEHEALIQFGIGAANDAKAIGGKDLRHSTALSFVKACEQLVTTTGPVFKKLADPKFADVAATLDLIDGSAVMKAGGTRDFRSDLEGVYVLLHGKTMTFTDHDCVNASSDITRAMIFIKDDLRRLVDFLEEQFPSVQKRARSDDTVAVAVAVAEKRYRSGRDALSALHALAGFDPEGDAGFARDPPATHAEAVSEVKEAMGEVAGCVGEVGGQIAVKVSQQLKKVVHSLPGCDPQLVGQCVVALEAVLEPQGPPEEFVTMEQKLENLLTVVRLFTRVCDGVNTGASGFA